MWSVLLMLQAAPVPVGPPTPPTIIVDCFAAGPYMVFFPENSAALTQQARNTLDLFTRQQKDPCSGGVRFVITGHVDRGEREGVDRRRARAVRDYLIRQGLRRQIIATLNAGNSQPRVIQPTSNDHGQNRRVVLEYPLPFTR